MKNLIDVEGNGQINFEIWVDTQTPSDRRRKHSYPYRFVNIVELWRSIIKLFKEEYPDVLYPIETFVFLVCSIVSDFTKKFHKYVNVSCTTLWNRFSELHHYDKEGKSKNGKGHLLFEASRKDKIKKDRKTKKETITKFEDIIVNRGKYRKVNDSFIGILNDAITLPHTIETAMPNYDRIWQIDVDTQKCNLFFYFLCQKKMVNTYSLIGISNYASEVPDTDVIFAMASKLKYIIENYDVNNPNLKILLESNIDHKKVKKYQLKQKKLASLKTPIPDYYGILTTSQMNTKIARIKWTLSYMQNGYKVPHYRDNFYSIDPYGSSLSHHGWKITRIPYSPNNANNTYLYVIFTDNHKIEFYEVEKTDEVFLPEYKRKIDNEIKFQLEFDK
jgi:hypothetical protein